MSARIPRRRTACPAPLHGAPQSRSRSPRRTGRRTRWQRPAATPGQSTVTELESVIDRSAVRLAGYPLALSLDAAELRRHIRTIASHREQPLIPLAEALAQLPDRQQPYTATVARMSPLSPPRATRVLDIDPIQGAEASPFAVQASGPGQRARISSASCRPRSMIASSSKLSAKRATSCWLMASRLCLSSSGCL